MSREVRDMLEAKHLMQTGQPARLLLWRSRTGHGCAIAVNVAVMAVAIVAAVYAISLLLEGMGA